MDRGIIHAVREAQADEELVFQCLGCCRQTALTAR